MRILPFFSPLAGEEATARIGCPVSTISRELDWNKGKKRYRHKKAQGMAQHRIAAKAAKRRGFTRPPGQAWPSAHIRRSLRLKPDLLA
ncbi:MAG: hypothetical protein SPG40_04640 [Kiritimatiellia bacterium]|nr:hypothetical protein [Kiritimatiellia bacterium]